MMFAFHVSELAMVLLPVAAILALLALFFWAVFEKACIAFRLRQSLREKELTRQERKKIRKEIFRRLKAMRRIRRQNQILRGQEIRALRRQKRQTGSDNV